MNERDELADILMADELVFSDKHFGRDYALAEADAILAAGYRKPRTITTVDELDALPDETVVRDAAGFVFEQQHLADGSEGVWWHPAGVASEMPSSDLTLPVTVLHDPGPAS